MPAAALIPLAITLAAEFAPGIVRQLVGPKAGEVAEQVVGIATGLAGTTDPEAAVKLIRAQGELQVQIRTQLIAFERDLAVEETKRLTEVNATIRTEVSTDDAYVRRMRPTWGYIMAVTWAAQMLAVAWTIVADPDKAGRVIAGMADLTVIWSVGLSVLGIYVYKRSREKIAATAPAEAAGASKAPDPAPSTPGAAEQLQGLLDAIRGGR